jgi:hypothetical protein
MACSGTALLTLLECAMVILRTRFPPYYSSLAYKVNKHKKYYKLKKEEINTSKETNVREREQKN